MMPKLPTTLIELNYGTIAFYPSYMVFTPIEGIVIDGRQVAEMQELAANFYKENAFGYISNRMNDYSRNIFPKLYTKQFPKLVAFAIVYKSESTLKIAKFEQHFIDVPFKTFKKMSHAKNWMLKLTENQK